MHSQRLKQFINTLPIERTEIAKIWMYIWEDAIILLRIHFGSFALLDDQKSETECLCSSSMRAASWLLLQMNQQNWFLIPARQRKRALERQGLEALTANVSIHQDWEHWWVLAQESQPNAALVPPPPRREGLWGCACGVLSQFIKMGERGCKHPNEGGGCH